MPTVMPPVVQLSCGQDATLPEPLSSIFVVSIICSVLNGSDPLTMEVYKDGVLIGNTFSQMFTPPDDDTFGTYTFRISNPDCGGNDLTTRILRQGQFLNFMFKVQLNRNTGIEISNMEN